MSHRVFGIRHHGPGSARSLIAALAADQPDIVLIEGPPEGEPLLSFLPHPDLKPPVAMLLYRPDAPQRAVFYPFAPFSPEWQALHFAASREIPVRFCDLALSIQLADPDEEEMAADDPPREAHRPEGEPAPPPTFDDPFALLAQAAGYPDFELWWEEQVERRVDATTLFDAIAEAMAVLRAGRSASRGASTAHLAHQRSAGSQPALPANSGSEPGADCDSGPGAGYKPALQTAEERESRREAAMREAIRAAGREGYGKIAVVCGAWHAPALRELPPPKEDRVLLKGLPRVKVDAVWIPWTNSRLAYRSGYGAGIASPGWYQHLWETTADATPGWIARAAHLLRGERLDAPASSVIDAVRLAETLAALRERSRPGLDELRDAIFTSLCRAEPAPMELIRLRLEIGQVMGTVPSEAAAVPLQRDVEAQARRLRLAASDETRELDLDLRRPVDLARSHFLHRLTLLGVPWGRRQRVMGKKAGTFHEVWKLTWEPALTLALIDRAPWGNTLADAAAAYARHCAGEERDLPALARLLHDAMLADLPPAVDTLLRALSDQAAAASAVKSLMDALPPLVEISRYGDVRATRVELVLPVIDGFLDRILIELLPACHALDDDAAHEMLTSLIGVRDSLLLLDRNDRREDWLAVLVQLTQRDAVHALLRGWACQILLEAGRIDGAELQRLAALALSPVTPAEAAAAWIEGVLHGSSMLLLQRGELWRALDGWLCSLDKETFDGTLPLLRRGFSRFDEAERRRMGERVKGLDREDVFAPAPSASLEGIDLERARLVLPVLAKILGVEDSTGA